MADFEDEVSRWIEDVSGEKRGDQAFGDWLKNGQVLCKLANAIQPEICPRIHLQKVPFKEMENISFFIQACKALGVFEKDVFSTVDLYEQKNLKSVCQCIHNLGIVIRSSASSFKGPYLRAARGYPNTDASFPISRGSSGPLAADTNKQTEVRCWLEAISGVKQVSTDFGSWLHDGTILCKVANKIQPNVCPKVHDSDLPSLQLENIAAFIRACHKLGVLEKDVFSSADLYVRKDMKSVCQCIYMLSDVIQTSTPSFKGPYVGDAQTAAVANGSCEKQVATQGVGLGKDNDTEITMRADSSREQCEKDVALQFHGSRSIVSPKPSPAQSAGEVVHRCTKVDDSSPWKNSVQDKAVLRVPISTGPRARSSSPYPGLLGSGRRGPADACGVAAPTSPRPILAGPLLKRSPATFGGWQLRWFELSGGSFRYWKNPEDAKAGKGPKAEVNCKGLILFLDKGTTFDLRTNQTSDRVFSFDVEVSKQVAAAKWEIGSSPPLKLQDWIKAFDKAAAMSRLSA